MRTTIFLNFLFLLSTNILITNSLFAAPGIIHISWQTPEITCGCELAGFRIYSSETKELLCETDDPTATTIDCSLENKEKAEQVEMTAICSDGTESGHSSPMALRSDRETDSPRPDFAITPKFQNNPSLFLFDASRSQPSEEGHEIRRFIWDFGDGTMGYGPTIQHSFASEGLYQVSLTVIDLTGYQATLTRKINVTKAQPDCAFLQTIYKLLLKKP